MSKLCMLVNVLVNYFTSIYLYLLIWNALIMFLSHRFFDFSVRFLKSDLFPLNFDYLWPSLNVSYHVNVCLTIFLCRNEVSHIELNLQYLNYFNQWMKVCAHLNKLCCWCCCCSKIFIKHLFYTRHVIEPREPIFHWKDMAPSCH